MLKRIIILDGNHLAYRAYYKFPNLKTFSGEPTSLLYGMPYVTESLIRKFGPDKATIVFDGGRSAVRKQLLPNYKEREKKLGFNAEQFYKQKDIGMEILMALGMGVAWERYQEADDIIAMIARRYSKKNYEVIIVSGDKDFNQLIRKPSKNYGAIYVYNTSKGVLIDDFNFKTQVGYPIDYALEYLILTGDKSDNIPGYPGIGPKKGLDFLEKFGSVQNFLNSTDSFGKIDKDKLREIYTLNQKLIDLKWFYKTYFKTKPIPWLSQGKFDEIALKGFCRKYEINSFLKPQFLNTFKNLYK